jgi:hypothetical protein
MPVLAEITLGYDAEWVDDAVATWVDDTVAEWVEGAETSLKIADRRFYDAEYWDELILGFGPVSFAMDTEYGGMISPKVGNITIAMTAFADTVWPPPREGSISIKYTETTYAAAVTLFTGSCHLASISYPESVVYNLYGMAYGGNMLEETLDYDGKESVYPRGFGRVEYLKCNRLQDVFVGGEGSIDIGACYTAGHILNDGNFRVYEDGYDITDALDHFDDYYIDGVYPGVKSFALKVFPNGEITVSGNGAYSTIDGVFGWACNNLLAKTLDYTSDGYARRIDTTVESQTDILSFLSKVAAGCTHAFYFDDTDMVLFSMSESVGTARTINIPAESLITTKIDLLAPKAMVTHAMSVPTVITDGIESAIERTDKDISIVTDFSYGDSLNVDVNSIDEATIKYRLQTITDLWHQERMSISLPMAGALPTPGQQIEIFDDRYNRVMTGTFHVRDISYDFSNRQVTISGEGQVV